MNTVVNKIEQILTSEYSTANFVELMQEIFDSMKLVAPNSFRQEFSNFATHIVGKAHIGNYTTPEGKKIAIFSVQLKKENYVEGSRNIQRSYAKKLIEGGNCDAAIIAFYAKDEPKWRLSFVRLDYEIKIENGQLKTAENVTPAKRYSYLVGPEEPCHTAISRFCNFTSAHTTHSSQPTLDDLEEVFSVEAVTNDFFNLYCEKYHQLCRQLESLDNFCMQAKQCSFTTSQFAKKLMGQIVFLYFLQKKGWLGVKAWPDSLNEEEYNSALYARGVKSLNLIPAIYKKSGAGTYQLSESALQGISATDAEVLAQCTQSAAWGTGPRDFIRKMFNFALQNNMNFYSELLEPLFYDALNTNRGEHAYFHPLRCRIPFLSGGLFEPIAKYSWRHNDFSIPNEVFSNANQNGRLSDGILDIFDRYNFTMCEDEPLEREVAIDPEMLGKVFENLLEVEARKAMGAFYTPREIVQYICQESLVNHLTKKTNIPEKDIRFFVLNNDLISESTLCEGHRSETIPPIPATLFALNEQKEILVNKFHDIDQALATVAIIDPAVGSGAFPLCMVTEIVKLRNSITQFITYGLTAEEKEIIFSNGRTTYQLKYHTIKNCIYGVDSDPSAVDIAKLRLWLSLIIDADDSAITLPHLDHNIICSDSLITHYKNTAHFGDIINHSTADVHSQMNVPVLAPVLEKLYAEENHLFNSDNPIKKSEHIASIVEKKRVILKYLSKCTDEEINDIINHMQAHSRSFTLWPIDFPYVFAQRGGFDIVVGNPPYVQLQKSLPEANGEKVGDRYSNIGYRTFTKTGDMYCLFYELGISLLAEGGTLTYITSNKWMRTAYGEHLRALFTQHTNPKKLIDFSGTKVFDTAGVDVNILMLEKSANLGATAVCTIDKPIDTTLSQHIESNSILMSFHGNSIWSALSDITENIHKKILSVGKPISQWAITINYGIKTGLNKVYVVDSLTKDKLCIEEPSAEKLMRPVLKGRDIHKWKCCHNGLWLVFIHNGCPKQNIPAIDIDQYPVVKQYMKEHWEDLCKRSDQGRTPYHLRDCAYINDFSSPKIIFQEMEQSPAFAFDGNGEYMCLDTARIVTGERLEYLTGLFNSNLFFFAVKHFFGGGKLGATGVRMKHTFFKNFTAYVPSDAEEQYIKNLVASQGEDRDILINKFFYEKYNLSNEEISFIEADMK